MKLESRKRIFFAVFATLSTLSLTPPLSRADDAAETKESAEVQKKYSLSDDQKNRAEARHEKRHEKHAERKAERAAAREERKKHREERKAERKTHRQEAREARKAHRSPEH